MILDIIINGANDQKSFVDYLPLVSPIIVIIIFVIDRLINSSIRAREIERNWYLKVLIEPNLENISSYYNNNELLYQKSSVLLEENLLTLSHPEYLRVKAQQSGGFQTAKRKFEIDVIDPIRVLYPSVALTLTETLLNLEDKFTKYLDSESIVEDKIVQFNKFNSANRAEFLSVLYQPIKTRIRSE